MTTLDSCFHHSQLRCMRWSQSHHLLVSGAFLLTKSQFLCRQKLFKLRSPPDPLDKALISSVVLPRSIDSNFQVPAGGGKIFLDLCAGASRPLSSAALLASFMVLSVDTLCGDALDLLCDSTFELLLRICFSGVVWFACASPPCGSSLRSSFELVQVQPQSDHVNILSGFLLYRSIKPCACNPAWRCLSDVSLFYLLSFRSGRWRCSLEQPANALSWRQRLAPGATLFARSVGYMLLCGCVLSWFSLDIHKRWMFATAFDGLSSVGCICNPGRDAHLSVAN